MTYKIQINLKIMIKGKVINLININIPHHLEITHKILKMNKILISNKM
jgi:hypothetical protein